MARKKVALPQRKTIKSDGDPVKFAHWLNPDATLNTVQRDPAGTKYRCTCCGTQYESQPTYFYKSVSPLYEGNNGFINVCKVCIGAYGDFLERSFANSPKYAVERVCQLFDLYFNDDVYDRALEQSNEKKSVIEVYIGKASLKTTQQLGTSYMDTLRERANRPTSPSVAMLDENGNVIEDDMEEESGPTEEQIEKWGLYYTYDEYVLLDKHYANLKQQCDPDDPMQDIYVRDMCTTKVLQNRAIQSNDSERFSKLQKSYQDTALKANLKPVSVDAQSQSDSEKIWGVFIDMVEKYTPAEVYKDQKMFKDYDGIGDYLQKTLIRAVKNFFTGSKEKDEEYSVDGDELES